MPVPEDGRSRNDYPAAPERRWITWAIGVVALGFLALMPFRVEAQNPSPSPQAPPQQLLKSGELDALVAPIALYPDTLVAQVLMASTYPLEVVQADRWVNEHKNLHGDRLGTEAEKQAWDDSVKSLVATPSVLTMMSKQLDWTQKLGDAVLAQQPDVMDAIQRLRSKAYANNKLQSSNEQKVTVSQENNRQVIAIEPTNPGTVYVPYYDPAVVYGDWPYPDYPPYYWYPEPGYIASGVIATGIAFGAGYALWRWASGGRLWGGRINWGGGRIDINRGNRVTHWQHNPQHRRGVAYNNANVRQRFGGNTTRAGNRTQLDFRGRGGQQVLKPGGQTQLGEHRSANRASAGEHRSASRAGAGEHRPANRANAGERARGKQISQANRPASRQSRSPHHRATAHAQPRRVAHRPTNVGGGNRRSFGFAGGRGGGHIGGRSFGGRGFGGGRGRRSDARLKHDVLLLGRLDNGLGFYRFAYNGSGRAYVGVMAQEVQKIMPEAVARGRDGYLRVHYDKLGLKFQTYDQWIASGAQVPGQVPGTVRGPDQGPDQGPDRDQVRQAPVLK